MDLPEQVRSGCRSSLARNKNTLLATAFCTPVTVQLKSFGLTGHCLKSSRQVRKQTGNII